MENKNSHSIPYSVYRCIADCRLVLAVLSEGRFIFAAKMVWALENALYICSIRNCWSYCEWTRTREQEEKQNLIKGNCWLSEMLWMSYQQHMKDRVFSQRSNARRVCSYRIILQRKIQTTVESLTLTAKRNAISENLSFLRWVYVGNEENDMHKFAVVKFGLPGHVLHRFHTNFVLVGFWTDSNFKALKERMWRSFSHLTAVKHGVRQVSTADR